MENVRLVTVLFENKITSEEMSLFRGCMIRLSGDNLYFHNHNHDKLRYSYPLIQYKRINGCAAIIGINEGGDAIEKLAEQGPFNCHLGKRDIEMNVQVVRSEKRMITTGNLMREYSIRRWLPLNAANYRKYQQMDRLADRIEMLEKILVGNILSFAKGINVYFDSPVICRISQLESKGSFCYKNVELMNFAATFQTNVFLPDFIGLGKSASINNGVIACVC